MAISNLELFLTEWSRSYFVLALETRIKYQCTFRLKHSNLSPFQAGFSYDNSVSLQTDDAGHVGAAVSVHVACVVDLQTNNVLRN